MAKVKGYELRLPCDRKAVWIVRRNKSNLNVNQKEVFKAR
jgi:hypothetical protein